MRFLLAISAIVLFTACGQNVSEKENKTDTTSVKTAVTDPVKHKRVQPANRITNDIIAEIKAHYQKELGKDCRAEEENTDSMINITYHTIPTSKDEDEGLAGTVYIPKMNVELFGANSILKGDINGDKADDLVISVQIEGEGGGNSYYQELFVFINDNGTYKLACITLDTDIAGCEDGPFGGIFRATGIENGYLTGNTDCYAEDDGHCCPSLHYVAKVKFDNGKLSFVSKEKSEAKD